MIAYLLVVLAVLTAVNWLANRHNKSFDSTANKRFSLSDQTEKVVKGLKQDAKITYFDKTSEFTPGARSAGPLRQPLHEAHGRLRRSGQEAAGGQSGRRADLRNDLRRGQRQEGRSQEPDRGRDHRRADPGLEGRRSGPSASSPAAASTASTTPTAAATPSLKDLLERNNYKTARSRCCEKPEVPKDCTVLVVGGPRFDYVEPAVNAIKSYVESGGRALVMLDPPLKFGKEDIGDNAALAKMLEGWGITLDKDLVLDTSGIGQIFGLGPEMPLVTDYETHPIVREMKEIATAFPIARSVEAKPAGKATREKLFSTSANSSATSNLSSPSITINPGHG